jgi:hypothetical protein
MDNRIDALNRSQLGVDDRLRIKRPTLISARYLVVHATVW